MLVQLSRTLKPVVEKGTCQVAVVTTYTNPEPTTGYERAERVRKDIEQIDEMNLLLSVLQCIRQRVVQLSADQQQD
jgi:hypothetical protein